MRDVRRLLRRPSRDRWGRRAVDESADDDFAGELGILWSAEPDESTRRPDSR